MAQLSPNTHIHSWNQRSADLGDAPHPIRAQWDAPAISRYFGWVGTNPHKQEGYFSLQVGAGIVRFLKMAGVLRGKVIDYGCGPGYLADRLAGENVELHASDFSAEAVGIVNRRLALKPGWRGAKWVRDLPCGDLADSYFDLALCIEAIEHLSDQYLESTLSELGRIVRPGGYVFLTTPNSEDLEKGMTYCPFCESEYHASQHVRCFTEQSLRAILRDRGWDVTYCQGIQLWRFLDRPWPGRWDFNLRYAMGSWNRFRGSFMDRLFPRPFPGGRLLEALCRPGPHLVALARKTERVGK